MRDRIRLSATRATLAATVLLASLGAPALAAGPPPNDDWVNAPVITAVPFSDSVDTTEATTNGDPFNYCGGGSATVWYRIELAADARVELSTAGSDYDTVIDANQWIDPPGAFGPIGCDDNGGAGDTSRLVLDLSAGQVYAIMVSSRLGQPGGHLSFAVSSVPPPANDDFDAATSITVVPFSETIDVGSATSAPDDPSSSCGGQGPSVWYDFTPDSAGRYAISTEGSSYDTLVTVYTGSRGALSEVACNDNYSPTASYPARLRFDANVDSTYHIAVTWGGGQFPRAGVLQFAIARAPDPPINDDIENATAVTSLPFGEDLDTSEATAATTDPVPSCTGPLPSTVWYVMTPATSDRIKFEVRGQDFQPAVALYRRTGGSLTELACSAGGSTPGFLLDPQRGLTYYVLVGGATDDAGLLRVDASLAFVVGLKITGGTVDRTGVATIFGTVTCNKPGFVTSNTGELVQTTGGRTVRAPMGIFVECDGTVPWTSVVPGESGAFVPGRAQATLSVFGFAFETGEQSDLLVSQTLTLKAAHR